MKLVILYQYNIYEYGCGWIGHISILNIFYWIAAINEEITEENSKTSN